MAHIHLALILVLLFFSDPMVSVSDLVDDPSRQSEFNAGNAKAFPFDFHLVL